MVYMVHGAPCALCTPCPHIPPKLEKMKREERKVMCNIMYKK